jgi:hypothetical protein
LLPALTIVDASGVPEASRLAGFDSTSSGLPDEPDTSIGELPTNAKYNWFSSRINF